MSIEGWGAEFLWVKKEGDGEDSPPIPIKASGVTFTFSKKLLEETGKLDRVDLKPWTEFIIQATYDSIDSQILEAIRAEERIRRDHLVDRLARICRRGHLHLTLSGRIFCDAMGGYL